MKRMALICAWLWTASVFGQVELSTVLLTGDPLPEVGEGVTFDGQLSFYVNETGPTITDSGRFAYYCHMNGLTPLEEFGISPELHDSTSGIITDFNGEFRLIARNGMQIPDMPGSTLQEINSPIINERGEILFVSLAGPLHRPGLFLATEDSLKSAVREGSLAADSETKVKISILTMLHSSSNETLPVSFNNSSNVTALVSLPLSERAMVLYSRDQIELLARGLNFGLPTARNAFLNEANQVVFAVGFPNGEWAVRICKYGEYHDVDHSLDAVGTRLPFTYVGTIGLNDKATVFFGESGPNSGVWLYEYGKLTLLMHSTQLQERLEANFMDGTRVNIVSDSLILNGAGEIAFRATLQGPNITPITASTIWRGRPDNLKLVFRSGTHPPGTPSGTVFSSTVYTRYCMNEHGQMVIYLRGQGYWHVDPHGQMSLIACKDSLIEVRPGDNRKVLDIGPIATTGGQDGRPRTLNDAGQFVFAVKFYGGSTAVMMAQLPD